MMTVILDFIFYNIKMIFLYALILFISYSFLTSIKSSFTFWYVGNTGCTTVNRMKENDITQLVDTVERYTRSQMKADEFQFMLIRLSFDYHLHDLDVRKKCTSLKG